MEIKQTLNETTGETENIPNSWDELKEQGYNPRKFIGRETLLDQDTVPPHAKELYATVLQAEHYDIEATQAAEAAAARDREVAAHKEFMDRRADARRRLGQAAETGTRAAMARDAITASTAMPEATFVGSTPVTPEEADEIRENRRSGIPQ